MVLNSGTKKERLDPEAEHITDQIARCREAVFAALEKGDRVTARDRMELAACWYDLRRKWEREAECLTYVMDDEFAANLVKLLSPKPNERICYVSGMRLGGYRTLKQTHLLEAEESSPIYVRSTGMGARDVLIRISDDGYVNNGVAHSHPGDSARATRPSGIDFRYLRRIQDAGSDAVGIIIVQTGFIRFFSAERPFEVRTYGKGIEQLEPDLFRVRLSNDRD